MKRFLTGVICGVLISGGVVFGASYMASTSTQTFYVNGQWVPVDAYEINGRNYFQLRGLASILERYGAGFSVDYVGETDIVYIDTTKSYVPETATPTVPTTTSAPTDNPFAQADAALQPFLDGLWGKTEKQKAEEITELVCSKFVYGKNNVGEGSPNNVFTSKEPVRGVCADYAVTLQFVCKRANVPCIIVEDSDHAWNEVYIEGKWLIIDATNYDVARNPIWLLTTYDKYPKQDENPTRTAQRKVDALK